MKGPSYTYLEIVKDRQEYLGERYFRLDFSSDSVLQICAGSGDTQRRGRSNNIGVYLISKQTLAANYMAMSYLNSCTKRKFDNKLKSVIQLLY